MRNKEHSTHFSSNVGIKQQDVHHKYTKSITNILRSLTFKYVNFVTIIIKTIKE